MASEFLAINAGVYVECAENAEVAEKQPSLDIRR
jgi:hypothetical protein